MAQEPEQLEREIEETRRNLGQNVDALADKVSPSRVVERRVEGAKNWFSNTKDRVMGSGPDDSASYGGTTAPVRTGTHMTPVAAACRSGQAAPHRQ